MGLIQEAAVVRKKNSADVCLPKTIAQSVHESCSYKGVRINARNVPYEVFHTGSSKGTRDYVCHFTSIVVPIEYHVALAFILPAANAMQRNTHTKPSASLRTAVSSRPPTAFQSQTARQENMGNVPHQQRTKKTTHYEYIRLRNHYTAAIPGFRQSFVTSSRCSSISTSPTSARSARADSNAATAPDEMSICAVCTS